jgi:hypothetical protein
LIRLGGTHNVAGLGTRLHNWQGNLRYRRRSSGHRQPGHTADLNLFQQLSGKFFSQRADRAKQDLLATLTLHKAAGHGLAGSGLDKGIQIILLADGNIGAAHHNLGLAGRTDGQQLVAVQP